MHQGVSKSTHYEGRNSEVDEEGQEEVQVEAEVDEETKKKGRPVGFGKGFGKDVPPRWADSDPTTCKATSKPTPEDEQAHALPNTTTQGGA